MENIKDFLNEDLVETLGCFIENKSGMLNQIEDFRAKDQEFCLLLDEIIDSLSDDLKYKFNNFMKLQYQLDQYYYSLAFFLGVKYI